MRRAKISIDEAARLAAVREFDPGITDTDPALQEITDIAARRFDVPIALVTLVRDTDQHFLARTGTDQRGTDRDVSFCSHALESDDLLVVPDARLDPRFAGNPLVLGPPHVRLYAGVPLRAPSGHVVGTLCIIDNQPRTGLSARDRQTLRALGTQALQKLEDLRLGLARAAGQHRFRQAAAQSPDAVASIDSSGRILFWNDAAEHLLGRKRSQALGRSLSEMVPALFHDGASFSPGRHGQTDGAFDSDARLGDGSLLPVSLRFWPATGMQGYDVVLRDIASRPRSDGLVYQTEYKDARTGLPSRTVLMERLADHVARGERVHLLHLGISGLPDAGAVDAGFSRDDLLKEVAQRVVESVGHGDTVARSGNDFLVLRAEQPDEADSAVLILADRILGSLIVPIHAGEQQIGLVAQIGIASCPRHADTPHALLALADAAMQEARRAGNRTRHVHGETSGHAAPGGHVLHDALVQALARNEFELFYQPQVDLANGSLVGAEALIRWNHPERGLLPPAEFLDQIEHGPLAGEVGTWVLEAACSQAVAWRRYAPAFRMGVNLFEAQLRSSDFIREVLAILDHTGLPPAGLELEITEKIMLRQSPDELDAITALHAHGVGVAFDDFGTGYASLCMLKNTPLTRLKVDRSFVKDITAGGTDALIVTAVANLGAGLGLDVLAEGIEDEAQWTLLRASGCRTGQGYWFGRPMPAPAFEKWMLAQAPASLAGARS